MTEYYTAPNGRAFKIVQSTCPTIGPWRPREAATAPRGKAHRKIATPLDGPAVASGTLLLTTVPPSVNSLYHNRAKGRGKTLAYRTWRAAADAELRAQPSWHVLGKVSVRIFVGSNRGDIDNRIKAAIDLLVSAGRIEDDKHVVRASAERADVTGTRIEIEAAK